MDNSFKRNNSILSKDTPPHVIKEVMDGEVDICISLEWDQKTTFDVPLYSLSKGTLLGMEAPFMPVSYSPSYLVKAKTDVSTKDLLYTTQKEFFSLSTKDSLNLLLKEVQFLLPLSSKYAELVKAHELISRMNALLKASMVYCKDQFGIDVKVKNQESLKTMEKFIKQYQLKDKLFPLKQEFLDIDFNTVTQKEFKDINIVIQFIRRLEKLIPALSRPLLEKDAIFRNFLLQDVAMKVPILFENISLLFEEMKNEIKECLVSDGLLSSYESIEKQVANNNIARSYVATVRNFTVKHIRTSLVPVLSKYHEPLAKQVLDLLGSKNSSENINPMPRTAVSSAVPSEFENALFQIIEYSKTPKTIVDKFMESYSKWLIFENKLSTEEEPRRLRNRVNDYYWIFYTNCFINHKVKGEALTPCVDLFLRYGFFDETLADGSIINACRHFQSKTFQQSKKPRIFDLYEWVSAIIEKEFEPSLDAMGETYDKFLKEKLNSNEVPKDATIESLDTAEERIRYEIGNLAKEAAKVCSGEISSFTPILMNEQLTGADVQSIITSKENIYRVFEDIRKIDFSAFYREVRYKTQGAEEFIKKEIQPIFILLPIAGKRGMVWQSKERPKESPGRLILPKICITPMNRVMINVFGLYRWEIQKELLGPLWNDISQLSLTAEYTDYIGSVKKNKELSEETREKILAEFKRFRSDRDRFANDYSKWIFLESQGRPGLNRVLRGIFFRQVPFPKELRQKLTRMPAFAELSTRYDNIVKREANKLKIKYQKYTKHGEELPIPLEEYLDFIQQ
jgi:hypothetical protein